MITPSTIYADMKAIFPLMLKSGNIFQVDGHDAFEVHYGRHDLIAPTERPVIFFHSIDPTGEMNFDATCYRNKAIPFRCGVKCSETSAVLLADGIAWQVNRLVDLFTSDTLFDIPFTFEYSGTTLLNQSIADLGISDCTRGGFKEYPDHNCKCLVTEMSCSYTFDFTQHFN